MRVRKVALLLVLAVAIATSCSPTARDTDVRDGVLLASPAVFAAWASLQNRYVLYANRSENLRTAEDLKGREIFVGFIVTSPEQLAQLGGDRKALSTILGDVERLARVLAVNQKPLIQNNTDEYVKQLVENPKRIGFVLASAVEQLGIAKSPSLISLSFKIK